jgi:hypothetical protein
MIGSRPNAAGQPLRLWTSNRLLGSDHSRRVASELPRTAPLTTSYKASMALIPDESAKLDGQAVGLASANNLIALRSGDGRGVPWPYSFPATPNRAFGS